MFRRCCCCCCCCSYLFVFYYSMISSLFVQHCSLFWYVPSFVCRFSRQRQVTTIGRLNRQLDSVVATDLWCYKSLLVGTVIIPLWLLRIVCWPPRLRRSGAHNNNNGDIYNYLLVSLGHRIGTRDLKHRPTHLMTIFSYLCADALVFIWSAVAAPALSSSSLCLYLQYVSKASFYKSIILVFHGRIVSECVSECTCVLEFQI